MEFNDLFLKQGISLDGVVIMRHRPTEPELRKVLPWLAAEHPDLYNAYQRTQSERAEKALSRAKYLASFIGTEAGKAVFVGLYKVGSFKALNYKEYWKIPAYQEMKAWGHAGFSGKRPEILWFNLDVQDFYSEWKGRLTVKWPAPERAWFRWASKNRLVVDSIHSESLFSQAMPDWSDLNLKWDELKVIPSSWRQRLKEWRGIYFIYDVVLGKGYVGSAYGRDNILGRWLNYSADGHGGNALLKHSNPTNLRFSILQRVSPDLDKSEVINLEGGWKSRLLTREYGLNAN